MKQYIQIMSFLLVLFCTTLSHANTYTDDFNRADRDLGTNWTAFPGFNPLTISGNKVVSDASEHASYWSNNTFSNDQYAEITAVTLDSGKNTDTCVYVRCSTDAFTGYFLNVSSSTWNIYKIVGGNATKIVNDQSRTTCNGTTVRLTIVDSTLYVSFDGNVEYQYTDTETPIPGGYPGISLRGTTAIADNWVCGDVSIAPILWYNTGSGMVYDMTTDGTNLNSGAVIWREPDTNWSIVGTGDFDGDGVRDIVWRNSATGQVYLMFMTSPTEVKSGAVVWTEPDPNWKIVATGDLNGDGKTDLIWWNNATGQVFAMLMNGASTPSGAVIWTEPNTNWKIVTTGDLNGDGRADIIWWNSSTGQVFAMLMNGLSVSGSAVIWTEPDVTNWRIVGAGDLDGDGKADLVWRNRSTGMVFAMLMNGTAVSCDGVLWTEPDLNWEIVSVDNYTTDAKADLLWRNKTTGMVFLLPMNGLATASGGSVLWTEPDMTWRIQGETEWRNNAYGAGITTATN